MHIAGDGRTYGLQRDAFKLTGNTGPANIQLTTGDGAIDCGPREGSDSSQVAHQDAIQVQSGHAVGFYGVTVGDWDGQRATCWGAGGAFFLSSAGGHSGQGITIDGMRAIACNHGLNGDGSGATTSGTVTRQRLPHGPPVRSQRRARHHRPRNGTTHRRPLHVRLEPRRAEHPGLNAWTLDHVVGDQWSDGGDPWSPGFNPAADAGP